MRKLFYFLAMASKGNPVISVATVILFYLMFNLVEANIEVLIFGERFEHWLDPVFALAFIIASGYSVYMCAIFNTKIGDS